MKDKPSISTGTDMSSLVSDPSDKVVIRNMQGAEDKDRQEIETRQKKLDDLKTPEMPKMPEAPKPVDYTTDPMKTWGSAAMMIGTLGSLLTRQPLVTALNSATAVNKAASVGDAAAYKSAVDKWKADSDYALKLSAFDVDRYKEAISQGESGIRAYAALSKNDTAKAALEMRQNEQNHKDLERQHKDMEDSQKNFLRNAEITQAKLETADWKKNNPTASASETSEAAAKIAKENLGKDTGFSDKQYDNFKKSPESNMLADAAADGMPITDLVRGRGKESEAKLTAIERLALERHPGLDLAQSRANYGSQKAAIKAWGTGKQGDNVTAINTSVQHLDLLRQLGSALENDDTQAINSIRNKYKEAFGSDIPTNFDAAKLVVSSEVSKATIGGVGAAHEREELAEKIKNAESPAQLTGAIDTYMGLLAGRLDSMELQYKNSTGKEDFQDHLLPATKNALSKKAAKSLGGTSTGSNPESPLPPPKQGERVEVGSYHDLGADGIWQYTGDGTGVEGWTKYAGKGK